jgi:integrase
MPSVVSSVAAGMRPGEVVIMRGIDLDMSGKVWLYHPGSGQDEAGTHKMAYRGHRRVVPIGPKGQEILRAWLRLNVREYLFSPQEAVAAKLARQRSQRQSRVQPGQVCRKRRRPKVQAGNHYTTGGYAQAIMRAVEAANKAHACAACKALLAEERCTKCKAGAIPRWHPHQLRHTKATEIRREAGLDAARAVLGHRSPAITEVYAEIDVNKATEVMGRLG